MKNIVLRAIAYINFVLLMTAICKSDTERWWPLVVMCITGGWLLFYSYANNWFECPVSGAKKEHSEEQMFTDLFIKTGMFAFTVIVNGALAAPVVMSVFYTWKWMLMYPAYLTVIVLLYAIYGRRV